MDVQKGLVVLGQFRGHPRQGYIAEDDEGPHPGVIGQFFPQDPEPPEELLTVFPIAALTASGGRAPAGFIRGAAMVTGWSPRRTGRAASVRARTE